MPWQRRARQLLLQWYPIFHALYEGTHLVYLWSYALEGSEFASPFMKLAGVVLAQGADSAPLAAPTDAPASAAPPASGSVEPPTLPASASAPAPATGGSVPSALATARGAASFAVRYGFIGFLVAFRLAEWWYSPRAAAGRGRPWSPGDAPVRVQFVVVAALPAVCSPARCCVCPWQPPPRPPPVSGPASSCRLPGDPALCPICRQVRVNDTASTAGIVYCYTCILQVTKQTGLCPVSGVPCPPDKLRRLYHTSSA